MKFLKFVNRKNYFIVFFSAANFWQNSIIQILREINFGEPRSCKTFVCAIFGTLNFVDLVNYSLLKVQKLMKNPNPQPLDV